MIRIYRFSIEDCALVGVTADDFAPYGTVTGTDPIEVRFPIEDESRLLVWLPVSPCSVESEEP